MYVGPGTAHHSINLIFFHSSAISPKESPAAKLLLFRHVLQCAQQLIRVDAVVAVRSGVRLEQFKAKVSEEDSE